MLLLIYLDLRMSAVFPFAVYMFMSFLSSNPALLILLHQVHSRVAFNSVKDFFHYIFKSFS